MNLALFTKKVLFRLRGRVLTFIPKGERRGHVLISHSLVAFLLKAPGDPLEGHANYWISKQFVQTFLDRGYEVDLIDWFDSTFKPKKEYKFAICTQANMERLSTLLPKNCIKILHLDGSHWLFHNTEEYKRHEELKKRRGILLLPERIIPFSRAEEYADVLTHLGNEFIASTYSYANKEMYPLPFPSTNMYPFPEEKDFDAARKNFMWFAGAGPVHKGLDITLEAFATMPEYTLTVCGKVGGDTEFGRAYHKELKETPNIKMAGLVNPGGSEFKELALKTIANVFPSCAEGAGGSGIVTLHAGILPIVTRATGITVGNFGIELKEATVEAIQDAVRSLANEPAEKLRIRAKEGWQHAREHDTREAFADAHGKIIDMLEERTGS